MPSESCYVTLIENAILLFVAYGLLASYFEDVMHYGFLFFAVFIGLCTCYASTALAFCIMLLDDTTSTQLLLLDADRPFQTPPNNIAHAARILARAATACSVALFVLFLTVACEFFTEDSAADSLPAMALKNNIAEPVLSTQLAVSTALAVYVMISLMLVGSSQQLNGIFMRLQYMTQEIPLPPAEAVAYATRADDFALFVRALLGLYVVICGTTGTFHEIILLDNAPDIKSAIGGNATNATNASTVPHHADSKPAIVGERRNYVALVFISSCFVTDALRALPVRPSMQLYVVVALTLIDLWQCFLNGVLAEVLFRDSSLTNFACAVLAICDGMCVLSACVHRVIDAVRMSSSHAETNHDKKDESETPNAPQQTRQDEPPVIPSVMSRQPSMPGGSKAHLLKSFSTGTGFGSSLSESHFNIDNIKMRVFEKKSN